MIRGPSLILGTSGRRERHAQQGASLTQPGTAAARLAMQQGGKLRASGLHGGFAQPVLSVVRSR